MSDPASFITNFRMTPEERERLIAYAEKRGRTPVSAVIRQAVSEFLDRVESAEKKYEGVAEVVEAQANTL